MRPRQKAGAGLVCVGLLAAIMGAITVGHESADTARPGKWTVEQLVADPCSALTEVERAGLGVGPGIAETGGAASECLWRPLAGTGPVLVVSLGRGERADIDRAAAAQSAPGTFAQPVPLRPYRALQARAPTPADCVVYVALVPRDVALSSRVADAPGLDGCPLATQIAATVLAHLTPPAA